MATDSEKLDAIQKDVTIIKSKIELVDKHEKILFGDPERAAEGQTGLINQVSGQGRRLDSVQGYIRGVGNLINVAVTAIIAALVSIGMKKGGA